MRNAIGCQINRHDMCFYLHVAMLRITCRYCDAPMSLTRWLVVGWSLDCESASVSQHLACGPVVELVRSLMSFTAVSLQISFNQIAAS